MAQIFPKWANRVPLQVLAALALGGVVVPLFIWYYFSPEYTDVGYQPEQPVPYSHVLHVDELGLDCRYCHAMVERSAVASVPPTQVCFNCHRLVARDSEKLAALWASDESNLPMQWVRVHNVPDYAFFDHSMHLRAGVGCSSCHGDIAAMEVVRQEEPLSMAWCLDCHRNPEPHIRPQEELFNTRWKPPAEQEQVAFASQRIEELELAPPEDCTGCHR